MNQALYLFQMGIIPFFLFALTSKKSIKTELPPIGIPIEELLLTNKVQVKIKGKVEFNGQCLSFDLENLTSDTLFVLLQSGNKLNSNSADFQDLFIVKSNVICLAPHQTKTNAGSVFYYENSSSIINETKGEITAEKWRKLAKIIDANDFPINTIQAAIWCITDNHPVSSISSEDMKNIQLLRRTVSEIQKNELSWYYITFHEDTTVLYPVKHKNVIGNIEFYLHSNAVVTINVRNKNGQVMATLVEESAIGVGKHKFSMNLSVSSWPKGEYIIYVYENYSKVNSKKTFEL